MTTKQAHMTQKLGVKRERTLRELERAAMRWYACDVQGKQTRRKWYSSEAGPLAVACARHAATRKKDRK